MKFVRVVERTGWDVEFVADRRTVNVTSKDEALALAQTVTPDWIELGEIVGAVGGRPQHHRWTTLRRAAGGRYERSGLAWGEPGPAGP